MAYIVFDTETADTVRHNDNNAHPETSLVYDLGWIVWDKDGNELARHSIAITDTFGRTDIMRNAYYADKLPAYYAGMGGTSESEWQALSFVKAWELFKKDVRDYKVRDVWAYNVKFDNKALNNSIKTYSHGFVKYFMPYKTKTRDIWDYASVTTATPTYCRYVKKNSLFTPSGNPVTNAETVYRYITGDDGFIESHTALSDAMCESVILQKAKSIHRAKRTTVGQGWRDASKLYKSREW